MPLCIYLLIIIGVDVPEKIAGLVGSIENVINTTPDLLVFCISSKRLHSYITLHH